MNYVTAAPEKVGISSVRLARIRPAMHEWIDRDILSGMVMMIARRGEIVYSETLGSLDKESVAPMPEDALFRIFSMTKPIVCAALMTLYEEGRFLLSSPLADFMPAFKGMKVLVEDDQGNVKEVPAERPITIGDLMTHTAGFTYDIWDEFPVCARYREAGFLAVGSLTLEQFVNELARLPLAFQPGTRWHYSVGVDVAAHLIEVLSGKPLRDYLRERIFTPLEMTDTDFYVPPHKRDRLATMVGAGNLSAMTLGELFEAWEQGVNKAIDMRQSYPADRPETFARGGLGLFSTAGDYMRFAQMLLNQGELDGARILGRKTVALMCANHLPPALLPMDSGDGPMLGRGHGLGLWILTDPVAAGGPESAGTFEHEGAGTTYFWVDPAEELIGVFMTQYIGMEIPHAYFRVLTYQAIVD